MPVGTQDLEPGTFSRNCLGNLRSVCPNFFLHSGVFTLLENPVSGIVGPSSVSDGDQNMQACDSGLVTKSLPGPRNSWGFSWVT